MVATALLLAAGLTGCGSSDASGGESYEAILLGLKKAAVAETPYGAVRRAEDLDPVERASLDAFCETNQEMLLNEEAEKVYGTQYYITRIKLRAERELPFVSTRPVSGLTTWLRQRWPTWRPGIRSIGPTELWIMPRGS